MADMTAQPQQAAEAWTVETQIKEKDEKQPLMRVIGNVTAGKVRDLTKAPINRVPYTSTTARSKKVIKMQNKFARERPVPKGMPIPGREEDDQQIPAFLPSEKPSYSLMSQMDTINRKAISEYAKTLDRKSGAKNTSLRRQHAFLRVQSKPSLTDTNEPLMKNKQHITTKIGNSFRDDLLPVNSPLHMSLQEDFINNNFDPSTDLLEKRKALIQKSNSMSQSERPSVFRSVSSGSTFRNSPVTRSESARPTSGYHPAFGNKNVSNSARGLNRRSNASFHSTSNSRLSGNSANGLMPVMDKNEIDNATDDVDLVLPGVCISTPRRPPTVRPSTNMKPSRTPTYCSCCSLCDTPKNQIAGLGFPDTHNHDLFPGKRSQMMDHCAYCQAENKKKIVQYNHGDIIKTFDWLSKHAKETPL